MKFKISWAEPDISNEEIEEIQKVMESGWISGTSKYVKRLEKEFSSLIGAKYSIAVCNGTAGLILGLLGLKELGYPIDVAASTWTYIATVNTARLIGKVKLVDCLKSTFNIDYSRIPKKPIIMPTDVGGLPLDYNKLRKLDWKPFIFADSAEAVGSIYRGEYVGKQADLHLFSFHATKIVTSGEGGILTTNRKKLYETLRYLNNQGYEEGKKPWDYNHPKIGYNFRMPSLQAAIAYVQLKRMPKFLRKRSEFARIYKDILGDKVGYQKIPSDRKSSYFLFTILVDPKVKNKVIHRLFRKGIQVKAWKPVHLQPPYKQRGFTLKNSEWLYERNIHLPIHNKLGEEDIKIIGEEVKKSL